MAMDSHVHCFPPQVFDAIWRWFKVHAWEIRYPIYADEVMAFIAQAGVERAMVLNYAHKPGMADWLNAWTRELMKVYPQHAYFGAFHQEDEALEAKAQHLLGQPGFAGVKLHAHVQRLPPDDERLWPLYEVAEAQGKVVLFHCGDAPRSPGYGFDTDSVSGVWRLEKVLKAFPELTVVVPHLGANNFPAMSRMMEAYPNLYADTAMVLTDFLKPDAQRVALLERFSDRILFGTDFPNLPYDYFHEEEVLAGLDSGLFDAVKKSTDAFMTDISKLA